MAFNPFHGFRKHKRTVFAALTILCMLTFVMSSGVGGAGDFFSEIPRFFGGRGKYPNVATLDGHRYTTFEIRQLQEQRRMANAFVQTAVESALGKASQGIQELMSDKSGVDEQTRQELGQIQQTNLQALMAVFSGQPDQAAQLLFQVQFRLEAIENRLKGAKKTQEANRIVAFKNMLGKQIYLYQRPKDDLFPQDNLYFGGSLEPEGIMQFEMWRHEADRLGIHITADDVSEELKRETQGRLNSNEWFAIQTRIGVGRGMTSEQLNEALANEFRVRMAQSTILGFDPGGFPAIPAFVTPSDLYDFYRKQRTEYNVKLLPLPVSKFLDEVKDKPTQEELDELFNKFKNAEYSPASDTPGFKQPRRLKVEWVEASPYSATYRQRARERILAQIAGTVGQASTFNSLALYSQFYADYEASRTFGQLQIPAWTEANAVPSFYVYASLRKPDSAAAIVGTALAGGIQGNILTVAVAPVATATAREPKTSAPYIAKEEQSLAPMVATLLGAGMNEVSPASLLGYWLAAGQVKRFLPIEAVQADLLAKQQSRLAEELVRNSLDQLRKDLEAKRSKPAEVQQAIDKYLKEYQWDHGASKELRDQYSLPSDPGLAKLKAAYEHTYAFDDAKGKQMAQRLFFSQPREQVRPYTAQPLLTDSGSMLYWKTVDEPAKVLKFEDAKAEVEKAWRWQKARAKAEKAAEELVQKCKGDAVPVLTDAAKQYGQQLIDLQGVARLKNTIQAREGFGNNLAPYRVPDDKIEFAGQELVDKILKLGDPGAVDVLSDQPKAHIYIAVITQKVVPTLNEFQKETAPSVFRQNTYLTLLEAERRREYRRACIRQLEEKAKYAVLDADALKELRDRSGSLRDEG